MFGHLCHRLINAETQVNDPDGSGYDPDFEPSAYSVACTMVGFTLKPPEFGQKITKIVIFQKSYLCAHDYPKKVC